MKSRVSCLLLGERGYAWILGAKFPDKQVLLVRQRSSLGRTHIGEIIDTLRALRIERANLIAEGLVNVCDGNLAGRRRRTRAVSHGRVGLLMV